MTFHMALAFPSGIPLRILGLNEPFNERRHGLAEPERLTSGATAAQKPLSHG